MPLPLPLQPAEEALLHPAETVVSVLPTLVFSTPPPRSLQHCRGSEGTNKPRGRATERRNRFLREEIEALPSPRVLCHSHFLPATPNLKSCFQGDKAGTKVAAFPSHPQLFLLSPLPRSPSPSPSRSPSLSSMPIPPRGEARETKRPSRPHPSPPLQDEDGPPHTSLQPPESSERGDLRGGGLSAHSNTLETLRQYQGSFFSR
mmetsp:Transcript_11676/g.22407  ORF Transcript_11676/g.22407 Transcript_11676/m.22407 type:complete len:203 (-) Transcript_11676:261-869(-)